MSDSSDCSYDSQERILYQKVITTQNDQWQILLTITNSIFKLTEENIIETCTKIMKEIKKEPGRLKYFVNIIYYGLKVRPKNIKSLSLLLTFISQNYSIKAHLIDLLKADNAIKEKNFQRRLLYLCIHQEILCKTDVDTCFHDMPSLDNILTVEERNTLKYYIKEDDIQELQSYVNMHSSFDFKQRVDISSESHLIFITHSRNINETIKNEISLLCFAAFYGSSKCFNFLILNNADVTNNLGNYAIAGGNHEIINYLEENKIQLDDCFLTCIRYHRNPYIDWLMDRYEIEPISLIECLQYCNEGYLLYCLETIEDLDQESIKSTLQYAREHGFIDMVPLLEAYSDLNSSEKSS